jgi:Root hair defective 3 GTP-binding protein (RHD3)
MIRTNTYQKFEKDALKKSGSQRDSVNEQFYKLTETAYIEAVTGFRKQAAELVVDGSGWGEQLLAHETELSMQLRALIANAREKELDKLQVLTQQAAKDNLEQIINGPIYELNAEFWDEIRGPFIKEMEDLAINC